MNIRQTKSQCITIGGNNGQNISIQNNKLYINDELIDFPESLNGSTSISQDGNDLIINGLKYNPSTKSFHNKKSFKFTFIILTLIISIGALIVDHLYFSV